MPLYKTPLRSSGRLDGICRFVLFTQKVVDIHEAQSFVVSLCNECRRDFPPLSWLIGACNALAKLIVKG